MDIVGLLDAASVPVRDVLGEPVEYRPVGGSWTPFRAVFDIDSETVDPDTGVLVRTRTPVVTFRDLDLVDASITIAKKASVRARGVEYVVVDLAPDGGGMTTARLQLPGGSL
jgi:hypothetical protein